MKRYNKSRRCAVCGRLYELGGYAHPSRCFVCAPVAVPLAKTRRWLRERRTR